MAKEKKFGGYTLKELEELLESCEDQGTGIDMLVGDEATSVNVIGDLVAEIKRLRAR